MQIVTALLVVVTLVPHRFLILTGEISKFTFSVTEKLAVETQSLAENSSMAVLGQRASSPVSGLSQEQTAHGLGKRVRPQQADSGIFPEYCCGFRLRKFLNFTLENESF